LEILIFFAASAISFIGSLQAGTVNIMVIKTTISKNRNSAFWLSIGGSLPEMIYATLAVFVGMMIEKNALFLQSVEWITIFVFIIFGLINIYKKKEIQYDKVEYISGTKDFLKGFTLAMLNPQLLIFWFGVYIYLDGNGLNIRETSSKLAFVTGAFFGALLLLWSLILISHHQKDKIYSLLKNYNINKLIGWFFISLALLKILVLMFNYFYR